MDETMEKRRFTSSERRGGQVDVPMILIGFVVFALVHRQVQSSSKFRLVRQRFTLRQFRRLKFVLQIPVERVDRAMRVFIQRVLRLRITFGQRSQIRSDVFEIGVEARRLFQRVLETFFRRNVRHDVRFRCGF